MEVTGKLIAKAGNGKGFKIEGEEGWFNASDAAAKFLANIEKGAEVIVTYEKKGVGKNVSKITQVQTEKPVEKKEALTATASKPAWQPKTEFKSNYGSPEDVIGKEVGCAAGVAATMLTGRQEDPETILEMWKVLTVGVLEHIRSLK
jgi:hypothetical protein